MTPLTAAIAEDFMLHTYKRWPVTFVEGNGARLIDDQGRSFVDFVAGIAVCSVGHSHPRVVAAIAEQAGRLMHVSNLYGTEPQRELARRLASLTDGKRAFFCNSGAEAIECALKIVRKWGTQQNPAKTRVIATDGGFHGRTFGALAATGQPAKQAPFAPMLDGFVHVPFGDGAALEAAFDESVAAVVLEPIQGEAGVVVPPDGYLAAARALCDRFGALLVVDEIQTGLGRTGSWFGHQHEGIAPDVICLAKALAAGLPIGACLAGDVVADVLVPGDHATTFGGGPVVCAAALAVLDVIESEGLVERSAHLGEALRTRLRDRLPSSIEVRGRGLMIGLVFEDPIARAVCEGAFERGLLVNDATVSVVRLVPPLVVTDEEIDFGLEILVEVIDEVTAA